MITLNGANNNSKIVCTFVFNCNAFCGSGGNCTLDTKQPETE